MTRRIGDMSTSELAELVRARDLDDLEVLSVLRNPYCSLEVAQSVASRRNLLSSDAVREKLASFPGMAISEAMGLLGTLPWTSLLAVAQLPRTPPLIRRQAERKLLHRLPRLTPGELIAMARRAHRPLFEPLILAGDDRVLIALLDNPRLVENDIVVMVQRVEPDPEFYTALTRHHRWGQSYGVRRALVQVERVPLPIALSQLVALRPKDLREIARSDRSPPRVRAAAIALQEKQERGLRGVLRSGDDECGFHVVECDAQDPG